MRKTLLFYLVVLQCVSCVQYRPKPVSVPKPEEWKTAFEPTEHPTPLPSEQKAKYDTLYPWWEVFEDKTLSELEQVALMNSPTLQLAFYTLQEAKQVYLDARSYLFPSVDLNAVANRSRIPPNVRGGALAGVATGAANAGTIPGSGISPFLPQALSFKSPAASPAGAPCAPPVAPPPQAPCSPPTPTTPATTSSTSSSSSSTSAAATAATATPNPYVTFLEVLPQISYEVDLWGQYAQAAGAAYANMQATTEQLHVAHLMLTTQLAQNYYQLRAADVQLDVLDRVIAMYKDQVSLQNDLYEAGLSAETDLLQVQAALATAEANYQDTATSRQMLEDTLAVLVGQAASVFKLEKAPFAVTIPEIPSMLPAEVLQNRPDVRASVYVVEEQRLNVGVAKTAFFPSLVLTGAFGFASNRANTLFDWKSRVLALTAQLMENLFAGGKTLADFRAAKAVYRQAVANYVNTVLVAYQEVEDALYSVRSRTKQHTDREAEYNYYFRYATLTNDQYNAGITTYFFVIVADQQALNAAIDRNTSYLSKVLAYIALINSLGGSWKV